MSESNCRKELENTGQKDIILKTDASTSACRLEVAISLKIPETEHVFSNICCHHVQPRYSKVYIGQFLLNI